MILMPTAANKSTTKRYVFLSGLTSTVLRPHMILASFSTSWWVNVVLSRCSGALPLGPDVLVRDSQLDMNIEKKFATFSLGPVGYVSFWHSGICHVNIEIIQHVVYNTIYHHRCVTVFLGRNLKGVSSAKVRLYNQISLGSLPFLFLVAFPWKVVFSFFQTRVGVRNPNTEISGYILPSDVKFKGDRYHGKQCQSLLVHQPDGGRSRVDFGCLVGYVGWILLRGLGLWVGIHWTPFFWKAIQGIEFHDILLMLQNSC